MSRFERSFKNNFNNIDTQFSESTGYGIISGLNVSAQTTPNMTVSVSGGTIHMPDGNRYTPSTSNVTIATADSTKPRTDVVYIDNLGTINYLESSLGTAAISGSRSFTITGNAVVNDTVAINGVTFTAVSGNATGNQFLVGSTTSNTATNLTSALTGNSTINSIYNATSSSNIITLTEKISGGGNTPTIATTTGTIVITSGTATISTAQIYPSAPFIPSGGVELAEINVGAGVSSIVSSYITDKRLIKQNNNQFAAQLAEIVYKRVTQFGAVADANYYNNGNYYVDSAHTQLATDNTQAFLNALNSGYNILFPPGNYYMSTGITLNSSCKIIGNGAKVFIKSSSQPTYAFYIKGDFTSIEGLNVNSTLDFAPVINGVGQAGLGSNIIAFQVEANYVQINNCKTNNCDYGVGKNTMISCQNLYVDHCSFENAAIPIFAFYITNMFVSNTYLSCNNTGLASAFHCVYLSDYATNIFFDNVKMLWPTDIDGGIIQIYSARSVHAKNVNFNNCEVETYGTTFGILGYCDGLTFNSCKFTCYQTTEGNKVMFSQGSMTGVLFKNCVFNIYQGNNIVYGSNTNELVFEDCRFDFTTQVIKNVMVPTVPVKFIRCDFIFESFSSGQFMGASSSSDPHRKLAFIQCYFSSLSGKLMFCNGDVSGYSIVMIRCTVINNGSSAEGYVFYNLSNAPYLMVLSCKFYGYNALCTAANQTVNDNLYSAVNNTYYAQTGLPT